MGPGEMPRKTRDDAVTDPIVRAIAEAETGTTGEVRVHVSRRLWERNPQARARRLFSVFRMFRTRQRNAVLLYLNLRRHRFAIAADSGIDEAVGGAYWQKLAQRLSEDLRSTHPEKAIALAVAAIGDKLRSHFPSSDPHQETRPS